MTREFVGRVPAGTEEKPVEAPIEWDEITWDHVNVWHTYIQPYASANKRRADRMWDWPFFFHVLIPLYTLRGHMPKAYAAMTYSRKGEAVPIGMLFMLTSYPRIDGRGDKAIFTFFLTTAPKNALQKLDVDQIPDLGRYLIDCGLVLSVNNEMNGHYWLHSTKKGKEWLMKYYLNDCKLKQFPASRSLPKGVLRANDGRFFFSDEQHTESLLKEFDKFRVNN
jgi:hypothetical protein